MNQVRILFFATLRDRSGVKAVDLQLPAPTTVAEFKCILDQRFPSLKGLLSHSLVAVNHEYVFDAALIPNDAEVAVFPPVSGG